MEVDRCEMSVKPQLFGLPNQRRGKYSRLRPLVGDLSIAKLESDWILSYKGCSLLWHTTVRAKGVAVLSSLKRYNRSKRGLLHRVEHYVGQIPKAAITENRFCDQVITNFVS